MPELLRWFGIWSDSKIGSYQSGNISNGKAMVMKAGHCKEDSIKTITDESCGLTFQKGYNYVIESRFIQEPTLMQLCIIRWSDDFFFFFFFFFFASILWIGSQCLLLSSSDVLFWFSECTFWSKNKIFEHASERYFDRW